MLLLAVFPTIMRGQDAVRASRGQISLPTYPWTAVKHPYFRGTDGVNIYPYPMLDFLSRERTHRLYRTVVLENEFLRLTFLPELGGKIHEVVDKTTGEPMFYVNHVIKPALIGQAGAWTSGGVEWNTGPQGHTVGCLQPVDVVILPREKDGSQSVAVGETERIHGTKWTVVVTLRPGRSFLEERVRLYNPTETIRPYYFWNCTAVPNTRGFRFIYPMTLGTDHGAEKFFNWPTHEGKDLTRGTNYQDASSIFAWHCDQDFFGSYNDDLDRGVVAYANHHQLPGKKAWTWGWGSYGTMHQMDLTDDDGPYNEIQTGPLLTQGEVGRLDPGEAVEWKEWWYPIHGMGGFTFANRDVAVKASLEDGKLGLRILGSGSWKRVEVSVHKQERQLASTTCRIGPRAPVELALAILGEPEPFEVRLSAGATELAAFRYPLELPRRNPPEMAERGKPSAGTSSEFAQAGWGHFLFARLSEAEGEFRKAIEEDPKCVSAHTGMAYLKMDADPLAAAHAARSALAVDPDDGRARYALAVAEGRQGNESASLDEAWRASLDPATAVAARGLVAKLLIRQSRWTDAIDVLSASGPWQADPLCRNRLAYALQRERRFDQATQLAGANLVVDPLDAFAMNLLQSDSRSRVRRAAYASGASPESLFGLMTDLRQLERTERAPGAGTAMGGETQAARDRQGWPYRVEEIADLRRAVDSQPSDGRATLLLGHLLFHLGRHTEGRELWQQAAELGAEPVIAYRALGMAAKTLDHDLPAARRWLAQANQGDPRDSIVARDLARILFALADLAADEDRRGLTIEARDRLQGAFEEGKGRSDFVALLARSHSRLGDYARTATLLDSVRITIWEGAHEAHDLFEEAHLALGDEHLGAERYGEALAEFDRALEYPDNLATGRLEGTREAHLQFRRGQALQGLGREADAIQAWTLAAEEPESGNPQIEACRQKARAALKK